MKPGMGSLVQAIKGFVQLTNVGREVGIGKTLWLGPIHLFVKITINKGILHIELTNKPTVSDGKCKNNVNIGGLNNRTESLIVI